MHHTRTLFAAASALSLGLCLLGQPSISQAATSGKLGPTQAEVQDLIHDGQPATNISPSETPYQDVWVIDNRKNDHAILVESAHFDPVITANDPSCASHFTRPEPTTDQVNVRIEAKNVGNPDAAPIAPYLHEAGFLFQANGKECQNLNFALPMSVTYHNIATDAEITRALSIRLDDKDVSEVTTEQSPTLQAEFSVPDDFVMPEGSVQFFVDGKPYGSPVNAAKGVAALSESGLAVGDHTITAVLTPTNKDRDGKAIYPETVDIGTAPLMITTAPEPTPSVTPTPDPTPAPSVTPTPDPSVTPTADPSVTPAPTATPSEAPSAPQSPSSQPSSHSSQFPSTQPTFTTGPGNNPGLPNTGN